MFVVRVETLLPTNQLLSQSWPLRLRIVRLSDLPFAYMHASFAAPQTLSNSALCTYFKLEVRIKSDERAKRRLEIFYFLQCYTSQSLINDGRGSCDLAYTQSQSG